jgi:hypothetical protein
VGNIALFEEPEFTFAVRFVFIKDSLFFLKSETSGLFKKELEHLLHDGDVLCVEGKMVDPQAFRLHLFHEANEASKASEYILRLSMI